MTKFRTLVLAATISTSVTVAEQEAQAQKLPTIEVAKFDEYFNSEAENRGVRGRISQSSCAKGAIDVCNYSYNSIAAIVGADRNSSSLDHVTWICAKDCNPLDLVSGIGITLRLLAPELPKEAYGSWLDPVSRAIQSGKRDKTCHPSV